MKNKQRSHLKQVKIANGKMSIYKHGRPPWFDIQPTKKHEFSLTQSTAFLIGIAGGSASGKTTVSERIIKDLDVPWVVLLCMDSFYKALDAEDIAKAHRNEYNFDHPNAFDYDLLLETLENLKCGKSVHVPIYDFKTHSRLPETRHVYGASVVIFEGIYALFDKRIVEMMDMNIFVHTDDDLRLARRLKRDIAERGRDLNGVLAQYEKFVKPSFDQWIKPTMRNAHVIIPWGVENMVAIDLVTKHIARQLDERGFSIRSKLSQIEPSKEVPSNVHIMEMTLQLKFIHTTLRDRELSRDDFIFYLERLSRLVVENALNLLRFHPESVTTPTGYSYEGLARNTDKLCGVSVIRSGLVMEKPLRRVCPNISIGKLLIQTSPDTHEPNLHYCQLPADVPENTVLLMDSSLSTGAGMVMAIHVLKDHGVPEDQIIVCTLIATKLGLDVVCKAFPGVRVVVSEIDSRIEVDTYHIVPGMGNIGDRYFGTN